MVYLSIKEDILMCELSADYVLAWRASGTSVYFCERLGYHCSTMKNGMPFCKGGSRKGNPLFLKSVSENSLALGSSPAMR